jgi:hypothetical protein
MTLPISNSSTLLPSAGQASLQLEHILTVWEKVTDLQMHFNEICMNLRRTAIGTLGALLAAGALAFRFGGLIIVQDRTISVALVFVIVALLVWISFYLMDRFWYHELLRASVQYAEKLSEAAKDAGLTVELDMSKQIRDANHKALKMSGKAKINLFYLMVAIALFVACGLLFWGIVQPHKG